MRTKQFRRFQENKKKIWAKKILNLLFKDIPNFLITQKDIGRKATTPQPCSCDMCGNPRHLKYGTKKDKLSLKERKEISKFKYRDDTFFDDENNI